MPTQTVGNVHISAPLSNLARLYRPDEAGFIADIVCPRLPVNHENDLYYVFDQGAFFGTEVDDLVADRAAPRRIEFGVDTEGYNAARRELAWDISDRERRNADNQLNLERNKQNGVLGRLMLKREVRVAALLRKTTNGGALALGANAGNKWDNSSTTLAQIAADVIAGKTAIRQAIGMAPNTIVIPAAVAEGMHKSAMFSTVQYTLGNEANQPLLTEAYPLLRPIMWGMRVLVPGVISNSAKEGATASYSDVWSEQVRMLYVSPGPAVEQPSVAYTFQAEPLTTRQWRDEERRVDAYATGNTIVEKVVAASAGYEINDTLT